MDRWQKAEVISKILGALAIPVAVAILGSQVAEANKQRDSETKFVELAITILSKEPHTADDKNVGKDNSLRRWAIDVVNSYSGVNMAKETENALLQNVTSFPSTAMAVPDPAGTWGVVFGGFPTLEAAKDESILADQRTGIGRAEIFRRAGSFRTVKVFVSRSEAEDALGKANTIRRSYIVNMSTWCPSSEPRTGYFECTAL